MLGLSSRKTILFGKLTSTRSLFLATDYRKLLAPALKSATFKGFAPVVVGANLRVLNLDVTNGRYYTRPPIDAILTMLSALSQSLEELRLREVTPNGGWASVREPLQPVTLPKLAIFEMEHRMLNVLKHFALFDLPMSCRRRIGLTMDGYYGTGAKLKNLMQYTGKTKTAFRLTEIY